MPDPDTGTTGHRRSSVRALALAVGFVALLVACSTDAEPTGPTPTAPVGSSAISSGSSDTGPTGAAPSRTVGASIIVSQTAAPQSIPPGTAPRSTPPISASTEPGLLPTTDTTGPSTPATQQSIRPPTLPAITDSTPPDGSTTANSTTGVNPTDRSPTDRSPTAPTTAAPTTAGTATTRPATSTGTGPRTIAAGTHVVELRKMTDRTIDVISLVLVQPKEVQPYYQPDPKNPAPRRVAIDADTAFFAGYGLCGDDHSFTFDDEGLGTTRCTADQAAGAVNAGRTAQVQIVVDAGGTVRTVKEIFHP